MTAAYACRRGGVSGLRRRTVALGSFATLRTRRPASKGAGAAQWLKLQHQEEQQHAAKVYDYLIDQGVEVNLTEISVPSVEFGSLLDVFEASLAHEQEMTVCLNDLSDQALQAKDHATYNLLQWFVNEQVEEEATLSGIIAKLRLVGTDGYGLLMIDTELGSRATASTL